MYKSKQCLANGDDIDLIVRNKEALGVMFERLETYSEIIGKEQIFENVGACIKNIMQRIPKAYLKVKLMMWEDGPGCCEEYEDCRMVGEGTVKRRMEAYREGKPCSHRAVVL